jgi:hypothetical protein
MKHLCEKDEEVIRRQDHFEDANGNKRGHQRSKKQRAWNGGKRESTKKPNGNGSGRECRCAAHHERTLELLAHGLLSLLCQPSFNRIFSLKS